MSTYFYSDNKDKNVIEIKTIAIALEHIDEDGEPYYYIKFILTNGAKTEWQYYSKQMRDKEILEIRRLKEEHQNQQNS